MIPSSTLHRKQCVIRCFPTYPRAQRIGHFVPRERSEIVLPRVTTGEWNSLPISRLAFASIQVADERLVDRQDPTSCMIVVSMTPSKFGTDWFEIWAAGVAVNTMCIQRGFSGTGLHLGNFLEA